MLAPSLLNLWTKKFLPETLKWRNASVAVSKCHKPENIATERVQDSSFEL